MNGYSAGSGPLGSGPTGPGSGFSVMPNNTNIIHLFKVGMVKIAKKLIKANHLTKVKLN